jgi:hypothetical protein
MHFPHDYMDVVGGIPSGGAPSRCGVPIRRIGAMRRPDPTLRAIAE